MSMHAVRKAISILMSAGHMSYQRFADGRTSWNVYEIPVTQTHDNKPQVDFPPVVFQPVLESKDKIQSKENTTTLHPPSQEVVVSLPEKHEQNHAVIEDNLYSVSENVEQNHILTYDCSIITNEELTTRFKVKPSHITPIRKSLKSLNKSQALSVMTVYAMAMSKSQINNPVGYITQLVKAVKENTLTMPHNPSTIKPLSERIAKNRPQPSVKISNEQWLQMIQKQYGQSLAKIFC